MNREQFFGWLNTCPTDKWQVTADKYGADCVVISFPVRDTKIYHTVDIHIDEGDKD